MTVFAELIQAIECLAPNQPCTEDQWKALANSIPKSKPESLSDVYNSIPELESTTSRIKAAAILALLKTRPWLKGDQRTAQKLGDYAAALIAPCAGSSAPSDDDGDSSGGADTTPEDYEDTVQRVREVAPFGLEIMRICAAEPFCARFSQETLLTLMSFTFPVFQPPREKQDHERLCYIRTLLGDDETSQPEQTGPWATAEAGQLASQLLTTQRQATQRLASSDALVMTVLHDYLRPLLSQSRPSSVTASGRRAEFPQEQDISRGLADENGAVKPWKYLDHRAIAVFGWAIYEASEELISKEWPMFIPVLLTLLDDSTSRVRRAGLSFLPTFLTKFPVNILNSTGLASVFEDAVFPTLYFLPPTTPVQESLRLLGYAYRSLHVLAGKLEQLVQVAPQVSRHPRSQLLTRVLREGVFAGYLHAKEHTRVASLLFCVTRGVVKDMGIEAVPHLKDLIPMHCEIFTDPFAAALAPSLLEDALWSFSSVIASCWPRLAHPAYQDEIIKALVTCYLNVHDDPEAEGKLKKVNEILLIVGRMFSVVGTTQLQEKVAPLKAKEPALEALFPPASSK